MADDTARIPNALREEDAFLALAETLSALIALIQGDKLVYVNPAGAAILGYPQEYYKGRNFWDFAVPEDREAIQQRGRNRQLGVEYPRRFVERLRHADGHVLWVDYSVDVIQLGGKITTLVTGHDISEHKKTEESLRVSEALFRQLFTQAPVMICSVDKQDRISKASNYWLKKLGYTQEEVIGTNGYQYLTPDSVQRLASVFQEKIQQKEWLVKDVPLQTLRKDGAVLDILVTSVAKLDDRGEHDGWITVAQDISEISHAQKALTQSEERFRAAFQNAAIGKAVTGADLRFVQVNRAFCDMLGYAEAEFLGKTPRDFTHPDDIERGKQFVGCMLSGERESCRQTKRYLHKNGRVVWVDMTATVVRDADGKPSHFVTEIQDISERKRAEGLLQASEERFRAAFENAAIGKAITGPDFRLQQVNRAFCDMVGYAEAELLAISPVALTHPEDRESTTSLALRILSGEQESGRQIKRYVHRKGHEVWVDMTTTIVRDAAGKPSYFVTEIIDITERKRAEELLKDREAKLAEAQRIAHVGSWDWDVAGSKFLWSEELFRIVGLDPATAASYEDYMNRVHPEDRAATIAQVTQGLQDGLPFESEHRIVRDNGDVRLIWTSCRMEKDATGKVVRMYGIAQDVTERKRAEDALRASELRFRSLYTQAPVMMIAFGADGRIREVSNYWLKVMGYDRQEVIGEEGTRFLMPESQERLHQAMEKVVRSGERVLRNIPLLGVRKDGRTIDILCTSVLEMDERGQSLGAIAVGVDVTEIRRAEEAVRESEGRYRALVEHAPEAILVMDVESGKFIDANTHAEVMFGYDRAKLLTMGPLDFCPKLQAGGVASHDAAWDQIGRVMRGEAPIFEFVHTHANGREIPCQIRLSRLPATGQNLIRASLTDISELKALEQQVRHGEKMAAIGLLAAGVAHEIGNPLLALSMAAQSLERKSSDEYAQRKLGLIREHIDRISKIVRQMSDLARPQSAQRNPCDVNRVLERTLEVVRYDKRAKEVPIRFDPCPDVPFVQAVEDQLTQVCLNLALNALDAVAANPPARPKSLHIRACCVQRGGRKFVRASFKDTGPGIPEAARSKIFQPFYTTKSTGKGTGLGLSVSYRIIQEHQGTLAFDCGSAEGTEFYFELPV